VIAIITEASVQKYFQQLASSTKSLFSKLFGKLKG